MWLYGVIRREKVKRKRERAEKSKKKDDVKQQKPDLTKLSANLPSGWQVLSFHHFTSCCFVNVNRSLKHCHLTISLAGVLGRIYQKSLLWKYKYISDQLDTTHCLNLNCSRPNFVLL